MTPGLFEPLRSELRQLTDRFAAAGHRLYVVGGTVRDLLVEPGIDGGDQFTSNRFDVDATTTALPGEIKLLVQGWGDTVWTQGERFGTIGVMKRVPSGPGGTTIERIYEITTHRAEAYRDDSRKPDVDFSDDVLADLSRRDFTVNAMAVELTTDEPVLVDPFGGVADLRARRLRTPLSPQQSFSDDPLRMLRAARFVAKYGLRPDPELTAALIEMADRLSIVSSERIRDELHKLLSVPVPGDGLRMCASTGVLGFVVPELAAPTVTDEMRSTFDLVDAVRTDAAPFDLTRLTRLAALLTPLSRGAARSRLRALRHSSADIDGVMAIVGAIDQALDLARRCSGSDDPTSTGSLPDGAIRRLVSSAGPWLAASLELANTIARRAGAGDEAATGMATVTGRIAELSRAEDLTDLGPSLDGSDVMRILGLPAGRDVGAALDHLRQLRLDLGPMDRDEATRHLQHWWSGTSGGRAAHSDDPPSR